MLYSGHMNHTPAEKKPDDFFSEKVMDVVGESFVYQGREYDKDSGRIYSFLIVNHSTESIELFANAVFEYGISVDEKSTIIVSDGYSVCWTVFSLKNFSNDMPDELYENFLVLRIKQKLVLDTEFWSELSNYTYFKGIRSLSLPSEVQKKADEEGIDWYSIWPDLEGIETF